MVHGSGAARRQERAVTDVTILFAEDDTARARSVEAAMRASGFAVSLIQFDTLSGTIGSPAIVALWSRAMAASRAAVSLGQSALGEGRLVSGRLDINVPASLFPGHAMHDLVRWGGDPDDACLDGLIAEADRCVLAVRAAPPPQPEPAPEPRPRPPSEEPMRGGSMGGGRQAAARAPANDLDPTPDPAAEEALYWRSIRASENHADFQAYLARYGNEGLFADLARERLRALAPPPPPPAAPAQTPQAVARFADSWRFGADWSTRTSPPRQGLDGRSPEPRPQEPRPQPQPVAPAAAASAAPPRAPTPPRPMVPEPAPTAAASAEPPLNGAAVSPGGDALRRAGPHRLPESLKTAGQRESLPSPVRVPTPEAMARAGLAPDQPAASRAPGAVAFDRELADAPWERGRGPSAPLPEVVVAPEPTQERAVPPVRARRKKKGGAGGFLFLLVLLLGAGGAAYYYRADLLAFVRARLAVPKDVDWPGAETAAGPAEGAAPSPELSSAPGEAATTTPDAYAVEPSGSTPVTGGVPPAVESAAPPPVERGRQTKPATPAAAEPRRTDASVPPIDFLFNQPSQPAAATAAPPPASDPRRTAPVFSYGRPVEEGASTAAASGAETAVSAPGSTQSAASPTSEPVRATVAPAARASIVWARSPSGADVADAYPELARQRGLAGRVTLRCSVKTSGNLDCALASEEPARMGFGDAALQVASRYRAASRLSDGSASAGREAPLTIVFKPK